MEQCKCYKLPFHEKFIKDCKCECHNKSLEEIKNMPHSEDQEVRSLEVEDWEKGLERISKTLITYNNQDDICPLCGIKPNELKDFIRTLLQTQKQQQENSIALIVKLAVEQREKEIVEKIDKLKKDIEKLHPWPENSYPEADVDKGYNQALEDIKKII